MKILGVLITLALMQMSCLADGFYFCFKPACTKTYLKFNQSQMVSHLVKNHKCKKLSVNKIKMPNNTVVEIKMAFMNNPMDVQNGWFWYAENDKDMNSFISAWRIAYPVAQQTNKTNNFPERSSSQWDSLVQERRNELNNREGTLRDLTTGNNNTRLPNGSYGAGMRGFRRF
jgi:hypothetical protein